MKNSPESTTKQPGSSLRSRLARSVRFLALIRQNLWPPGAHFFTVFTRVLATFSRAPGPRVARIHPMRFLLKVAAFWTAATLAQAQALPAPEPEAVQPATAVETPP